jgi:hypothetical protein
MRKTIAGILTAVGIMCITSVALADDFKTVNGKEYKNATITRVEPDGIVLKYKSGLSKVYFIELPKEVQERFQAAIAAIAQFNAKAHQEEAAAREEAMAKAKQEQAQREKALEAMRQDIQEHGRPPVGFMQSIGGGGNLPSSARFKDEIKPMGNASDAILALKPVTFRYKQELDPLGTPQFGLVAEEVEKVNPELVTREPDGKLHGVRYDAVNAMLLNEFLKEHRKIEEQGATITQLKTEIEAVVARLKEQDSTHPKGR